MKALLCGVHQLLILLKYGLENNGEKTAWRFICYTSVRASQALGKNGRGGGFAGWESALDAITPVGGWKSTKQHKCLVIMLYYRYLNEYPASSQRWSPRRCILRRKSSTLILRAKWSAGMLCVHATTPCRCAWPQKVYKNHTQRIFRADILSQECRWYVWHIRWRRRRIWLKIKIITLEF